MPRRLSIDWFEGEGRLAAYEPTPEDVREAAAELAAAYNDEHNRAMMGHAEEMSAEDVVAHYAEMASSGARTFFLANDGRLVGDADLRGIEGRYAEFAIMVGPRAAQGKGLGTRFAKMIHAAAFTRLGLERLYVTIVRENAASRRLFEKLGYRMDDSAEARARVDEDDDVSMSIGRADFERAHGTIFAAIRVAER